MRTSEGEWRESERNTRPLTTNCQARLSAVCQWLSVCWYNQRHSELCFWTSLPLSLPNVLCHKPLVAKCSRLLFLGLIHTTWKKKEGKKKGSVNEAHAMPPPRVVVIVVVVVRRRRRRRKKLCHCAVYIVTHLNCYLPNCCQTAAAAAVVVAMIYASAFPNALDDAVTHCCCCCCCWSNNNKHNVRRH